MHFNQLLSKLKFSLLCTIVFVLVGCGGQETISPPSTSEMVTEETTQATMELTKTSTAVLPTEEPTTATETTVVELPKKLLLRAHGLEYGYTDLTGEWLIDPQFEDALEFSEGVASVRIDGLYGYIDETGQMVIEPQFNAAQSFSEGLAAVMKEQQWGYIDQSGKFVIEPQFEFANTFSEGLANITVNGRIGFINTTGEIVIDPQAFDFVQPFSEGLAVFGFEGLSGYIDTTGQFVVQPQYTFADNFSEGLAAVELNDKTGYIDSSGEFIIEPQFALARNFSEGLAAVMVDDQVGYIDKTGTMIVEPQFESGFDFSEGLAAVLVDDLWGYIDPTGEMLIEPQFALAGDFEEGLANVAFAENRTAYIDPTGAVVIDVKPAEQIIIETTLNLTPDQISFDYDPTLATETTSETIPGETTLHPDIPYFALYPEHLLFTLNGSEVLQKASYEQGSIVGIDPQLLVYPAVDYAKVSQFAGDQIQTLKTLLVEQPETITFEIPVLPLVNAAQVFHSQVAYLNFQNGNGIRFVTQYAREPRPITNAEIFYTFQGLTSDGQYYVSFFYPVSTMLLPNTPTDSEAFKDYETFVENLETYMPEAIQRLNALSAENYTPELTLLDAVVESIQIETKK